MSLETRRLYLIGLRAKTAPGPLWRAGSPQSSDLPTPHMNHRGPIGLKGRATYSRA